MSTALYENDDLTSWMTALSSYDHVVKTRFTPVEGKRKPRADVIALDDW